jgi:hypothetical protein
LHDMQALASGGRDHCTTCRLLQVVVEMHGSGNIRWKPTTILHRGKAPAASLAYQRAIKDRDVSRTISEALGYRAARAVQYFMAQEMWQEGLDLAAHIQSPQRHKDLLEAFCHSGDMKVIFEAVTLRQLLNIPMDEYDPTCASCSRKQH